jgi:ATP-dependent Zn protease
MSTFNYAPSVATAKRLIAKFGKPVTLKKKVKGGSNSAPTYTYSETAVNAVDLNIVNRDRDGTLTGTTSRKLLIEGGVTAVPEKKDLITIESVDYAIDVVKLLNTGGTNILYTVFLEV